VDRKFFILGISLLTALVLGTLLLLFIQNRRLSQNFEDFKLQVMAQSTQNNQQEEIIYQNLQKAAASTDSLRRMLGLAPVNWQWEEEESTIEGEDHELEDLKKLDVFYSAIDLLSSTEKDYALSNAFNQTLEQSGILKYLQSKNIQLRQDSSNSASLYNNRGDLFSFSWKPDDQFTLNLPDQNLVEGQSSEALIKTIDQVLKQQEEAASRTRLFSNLFRNLLNIPEVQALVRDKGLKPRVLVESLPVVQIRLSDYTEFSRITINEEKGQVMLEGKSFQDPQAFTSAFIQYLSDMDARTEAQKKDQEAMELIKKAQQDSVFQEYLKNNGYTLAEKPREDAETDYLQWDIIKKEETIGSIGLLKGTGELYLLDDDGIQIKSFRGFSENHRYLGNSNYEYSEDFEVINDLYSSSTSTTYLLIGTHEKNADTIILAHADASKDQISMISIPRDLWYKGRRINSVYRYFGPEALLTEVSDMTGLTIDHYLSVDMYAFIEIVNIMGGIDIVLESPLIDPNHKIKENGQWTTLHYPAGPLHLDGLGALRVARSRHTSNDFERARRQQQVITAMKNKAVEMGLNDMDKLFQFIDTAQEYTESDLRASEMLRAFLKYKDADIEMGNVIDTSNVLYSSYSNLYLLSEEEQKGFIEDSDSDWGAWILLPKNNDWNLIKWYIREIIQS